MNLSRRRFFGLLAGACAGTIIKPKRSFFFFEGPREIRIEKDEVLNLQAAIDRLDMRGGTIVLPRGTWILNQDLFLPEDVILRGEGNLTITACHIKTPETRKRAWIETERSIEVADCIFSGVGLRIQ